MGEKRIQKNFYYRDEQTKQLIESLLNDEAEVTNRSTSFLIEQHIMKDFLPEYKIVASWILMLYGKENATDMTDILILAFATIAGLNKYNSAKINYKPIIEFCFKNSCLSNKKAEIDASSTEKLKNHLGSVIERLKMKFDDLKATDPEIADKKLRLNIDLKELNRILETDKLTDYDINTLYITTLNNWDLLYDWFHTYSMLTVMVSLQTFNNTAETRFQLVKLLNDLAKYID